MFNTFSMGTFPTHNVSMALLMLGDSQAADQDMWVVSVGETLNKSGVNEDIEEEVTDKKSI